MKKLKENLFIGAFYLFIALIVFGCSFSVNENDEYVTSQKTNNNEVYVLR